MAEVQRQDQAVGLWGERQCCAVVRVVRAVMVRTGEQNLVRKGEVRGARWDGSACRGFHGAQWPRQEHEPRARTGRECRMRCRCEWSSGREHSTLELQAASWMCTRSVINNMQGHARSRQERHHCHNKPTAATRNACMAAQRGRPLGC